jgi:hypothetical protein
VEVIPPTEEAETEGPEELEVAEDTERLIFTPDDE